jgi:beta-galactosidase
MLGIIENKFVIGRDEFFPFSAEMHYFRVEKRYWSICFERIKRAGFKIISSYVPWNLHEIRPGEFDFRGVNGPEKDLIVFLELCREFGFKVILKPGPWIKGDWFNGGLPQYIFADEAVVAAEDVLPDLEDFQ